MTAINEATPGVFNWVDLMSPDVDASVEFYSAVFGWDAEDQFDADGNRIYTMMSLRGRSVAGIGGQAPGMEGAPPVWNSYVATDDLEKTTELVEPAGGTVMMPPMDVEDAGRMAIYSAPDGAMISAWQPGTHIGAELANEDGAWAWNELMTRDLDAARPFYEQVFGWTYGEMDMGPMGTYYLATVDDRQMAGLMPMPPGVPDRAPNHWGVYIAVDDLDAAIRRITDNGGRLVSEKNVIPDVGTTVMAHDPQSGSFSLLQPERQA